MEFTCKQDRPPCEHGKRKTRCNKCNGAGICSHGKQKSRCVECGGSEICFHKIRRSRCVPCHGSETCEHLKLREQCHDCKGSSFCIHGTKKTRCKICGGSEICIHMKRKSDCRDCGGSSYCIHAKDKRHCKACDGRDLCKSSWCELRGIPKYNGHCLRCTVNLFPDIPVARNYKTKELDVCDRVIDLFPSMTWISDKLIADGCSKRRPDLRADFGTHIIIVEVDEHAHTVYDCSCEHKRLMEISQDVGHRPIVFIRFNPDAYTNGEGVKVKSCWYTNKQGIVVIAKTKEVEWSQRIDCLQKQIKYWIVNPSAKTIEIVELFY